MPASALARRAPRQRSPIKRNPAPWFWGVCVPDGDLSDAFPGIGTELASYAAAGAEYIRTDFRMSNLAGGDYTAQDARVSAILGAGLKVYAGLNAISSTDYSNPTNRQAYADYCAAAVAHYAGQVEIFEITNEPNLAGGTAIPMADYAELLKLAYVAIKKANPRAIVIAGALASVPTTTGGHQAALAFVTYLYDNCRDFFDAISLHCYTDSASFSWPMTDSWHTRPILLSIIALMEARGDFTRLLYISETGMPNVDDDGTDPTEYWAQKWIDDIHAELVIHPRIGGLIYYSGYNKQAEAVQQDNYGLFRANYAQKRQYHAFAKYATLGKTLVPTFEFEKGTGTRSEGLFRRFIDDTSPIRNGLAWSIVTPVAGCSIDSNGVFAVDTSTVAAQLATLVVVEARHRWGYRARFAFYLTVYNQNLLANGDFGAAGNITGWEAVPPNATAAYDGAEKTGQGSLHWNITGSGGGYRMTAALTGLADGTYERVIWARKTDYSGTTMNVQCSGASMTPPTRTITANYEPSVHTIAITTGSAQLAMTRNGTPTGGGDTIREIFRLAL